MDCRMPLGKPLDHWEPRRCSNLCLFQKAGLQPPLDYNASTMVFVPKGEDVFDKIEISRASEDTRPLSLNNSDKQTIAAVQNNSFKPAIKVSACGIQRGFVPGRQLLANVADLDTAAREYGMRGHMDFASHHESTSVDESEAKRNIKYTLTCEPKSKKKKEKILLHVSQRLKQIKEQKQWINQ
jgi:hypothetical protein